MSRQSLPRTAQQIALAVGSDGNEGQFGRGVKR